MAAPLQRRALWSRKTRASAAFALPAITAGVHFKYNDGIGDINQQLGGALSQALGYERSNGTDFTLTFTKTLPPEVLGRPLILSAGIREEASGEPQVSGFTDKYLTSFECNVAYPPFDNVVLAYEFRQKSNPFSGEIQGLVEGENNWHAFDAALILNKQTTLVGGYGIFGNLANEDANSAWWIQLKHEF